MNPSLKLWQKMAHDLAVEKGFYDNEPAAEELGYGDWLVARLALIGCEVSEAIECVRKREPETLHEEDSGKPVGLPIELADIFLRLVDFCESVGVDLEKAVELKHRYNITRARKHGKAL